jgi:[NiFe] hydrogenase diaphorase moiety small subunit
VEINIDTKLSKDMSDDEAQKAMEVCPVGAILRKERGFIDPIGRRKYDNEPIGSEIETIEN